MKFEKVNRFKDVDLPLPTRGTADSAGYDFVVAEDTIVPSFLKHYNQFPTFGEITLDEAKNTLTKLPLVSTGMKCYLDPGTYLELSVRSSTPLKYHLILANGVGIIDRDYADNPGNEGEIFFQLINLSPYDILLKRGDKIGQGIIKQYLTVDDDNATGARLGGFGSTT